MVYEIKKAFKICQSIFNFIINNLNLANKMSTAIP